MLKAFATNPRASWLVLSIGLQGGWRWNLQFEVLGDSCTSHLFLCKCDDGSITWPFLFLKALGESSSWTTWLRESWNFNNLRFTSCLGFSMSIGVWVALKVLKNLDILLLPPPLINILLISLRESNLLQVLWIKFLLL